VSRECKRAILLCVGSATPTPYKSISSLRVPRCAPDEFYLAAIVRNLMTLAKHIWQPMLYVPAACVT